MIDTADLPKRFAALDGWRGVCAVLVALHHFSANGTIAALPLIRNAWLFVDFFFVLSGSGAATKSGLLPGAASRGFGRCMWQYSARLSFWNSFASP
jgi:peptidoglycan/LPS O-acetylase OafA/YrhL